ncbi:PH domain-containing protein [Sphingobacterium bambusae]|uniref:PH domain-containing protein n=1 Tax=Sphingobacterium bambusae TaxID=662858 RepID=A0ABW6BFN8_9SPHI|nr:PH domain-containing protein [Sphingobacterium bambusae]WPL50122.1 PH domain-containing protein [Sphingobacterium bambusae]
MAIEKFLQDGQDPKVVEKIHDKIIDMLTAGEFIQYISLQKKPAVTLLPDSITVSNKRIFLCEFTKLGLATNFEIFSWTDIKDIAFKEEIFGSKVTVIPQAGENLTIDYIPKVQARKLYQLIKEALETAKAPAAKPLVEPSVERPKPEPTVAIVPPQSNEASPAKPVENAEPAAPTPHVNEIKPPVTSIPSFIQEAPAPKPAEEEDELTQKLKKLKTLYDRQLITQAEYETKKTELLSQL